MLLFGFIVSCGVVIVIEIFDSSIKNEDFLEKITNLKTLVKLPKKDEDLTDKFRLLRVNIGEYRSILITSAQKGEGKSFVSLNLAKSYAKLGKKVVLIDLNNNSSDIAKNYNGNGLTEYLESNENSTSNYVVETNIKNLDILLAGKDLNNQEELLESYKMKDTLKLLENLYDVVIIDSDNALESANTLVISKLVKGAILVVSERQTNSMNIIKAKNNIQDVGGIIIGTVYNNSIKK